MAKKSRVNRRLSPVRSVSFKRDVFDEMETRRRKLRMDRSEFINRILEGELGLLGSPAPHVTKAMPDVPQDDGFPAELRRAAAAQPAPAAAKAREARRAHA